MSSQSMSLINIDDLRAKTDALIDTMYAVRDDFSLIPQKEHIGTCINYSDLIEMRDEFLQELILTVVQWVYSRNKQETLLRQFEAEGRDLSGANVLLSRRAISKFRRSDLQGQFSELLLANLLQHYFKAVPLLRKMTLTTNTGLERNGADAIHLANQSGKYVIYLGEAKTHAAKDGNNLKTGLKEAVHDVLDKYKGHRKELDLYLYEDFISPELEQIARRYKSGTLTDIEIHLVCIVTYDICKSVEGMTRQAKLDKLISCIKEETSGLKSSKAFSQIPGEMLPRMNYIIFPVQNLNSLIASFTKQLTGE
jgi:hypothetical protein